MIFLLVVSVETHVKGPGQSRTIGFAKMSFNVNLTFSVLGVSWKTWYLDLSPGSQFSRGVIENFLKCQKSRIFDVLG